jgi:hypothetical protein
MPRSFSIPASLAAEMDWRSRTVRRRVSQRQGGRRERGERERGARKGGEGKRREGKKRTVEKEHQDQRRHDPNVELASSIATMSSELFRRETCETGSETGGDELSMLDRGFCRFEVDLARVVGKVSRC